MNWTDGLREKISQAVVPLIADHARHICIIDPPNHQNVGDSAILLGELHFLEAQFPRSKVSFYDVDTYSPAADRYIEEASILLVHGGGNFGDIWPHHHNFRKTIIERFAHKRIVQLPQSISFSDPADLADTQRLIAGHPDFTLMVRDTRSLEFAQKTFECPTVLAPDMAFAMKPIRRLPPSADIFCLLRSDKEAVADHAAIRQVVEACGSMLEDDWLDTSNTVAARLDRKLKGMTRRRPARTAPLRGLMVAVRRAYAADRVARGVHLLSQGRQVVTDRLHAHVLASLLDIPNYAFDSFDRKISALYETWTHEGSPGRIVTSAAELREHLEAKAPL